MTVEFGHVALILALALALVQAIFPLAGANTGHRGWMALARFIRCRPGGSHGYDPAPETRPDVPFWQPWRYGDWKSGPRGLVETPPEP